jgi:hypothetical protein
VVVSDPRQAVNALRARERAANVQVFGDRLHVWLDVTDADATVRQFSQIAADAGVTPTSVRAIVPSLEDVFISKLTV